MGLENEGQDKLIQEPVDELPQPIKPPKTRFLGFRLGRHKPSGLTLTERADAFWGRDDKPKGDLT